MIGVVAKEAEKDIVKEFFQLFKTPWEFFRETGRYEVVIVSDGDASVRLADLTLIFGSRHLPFDGENGLAPRSDSTHRLAEYDQLLLPIYGGLLVFESLFDNGFRTQDTGEAAAHRLKSENRIIIRIGYDLFYEVAFLLTEGQPAELAHIPTLDHHIDALRRLMIDAGVSVVEIPPAPHGRPFMVCLTHDVDFLKIRRHFLDRTFFGFLYRASVGSLIDALKGRIPAKKMARNWYALFLLPLVFLGLVEDFWEGFEAYLQLEGDLPSTFFLVPFKNQPGRIEGGSAPETRAVRYEIGEIPSRIRSLLNSGREIALHGIDAWFDPERGRREKEAVARLTRFSDIGVRMHWLYFAPHSARKLSDAGFCYDSTIGYNAAVGFRSGTLQSYRLPNSDGLPELPLNVMDTALFYPDRMNLTESQAWEAVRQIIDGFDRAGGVMTINWHLRSIAPERCWDEFYRHLLAELKNRRACFATCTQAVKWFQKRRSVSFEKVDSSDGVSVKLTGVESTGSPGMTLRIHKPNESVQDFEIPDSQGEITIRS